MADPASPSSPPLPPPPPPVAVPDSFRVLALMTVFNEADILPFTVAALLQQDVDVYVVDDDSTDGTRLVVQALQAEHGPDRVRYRHLAPPPGAKTFNNVRTLQAKEDVWTSAECDAYAWAIHVDADEFLSVPAPSSATTLREAIYRVHVAGQYNVIGFRLVNFYAAADADEKVVIDPRRRPGNWRQRHKIAPHDMQRAFKRVRGFANAQTCGHWVQQRQVGGEPVRVAPDADALCLDHYPIRSAAHYVRKVQNERLALYDRGEKDGRKWHTQYQENMPYDAYLLHLAAKGPFPLEQVNDKDSRDKT